MHRVNDNIKNTTESQTAAITHLAFHDGGNFKYKWMSVFFAVRQNNHICTSSCTSAFLQNLKISYCLAYFKNFFVNQE